MMSLKNENNVFMLLEVRKLCILELSRIRCIISPIILISKKRMGSFISFIRKSEIMEMLILAVICNKIQLRINSTMVWLVNNTN